MRLNNKFYFFKGRVALYVILKAIGLKKGDEVILPGFTCVVVPNAIKYLNAKPVYVDIDANTYNINVNLIKKKITKKTKAIIAQHTFGIPADMDKINKIAKKHGIYVIEDSAHAIGSKYNGKEVGTLGDASFFSTQWSKPITTGLGGFCIVNNPDLKKHVKEIYNSFNDPDIFEKSLLIIEYYLHKLFLNPYTYWFLMLIYRKLYQAGFILGSSSQCELDMDKPDRYELKMSKFQRLLVNKKISTINKIIEHRREICLIYKNGLKKMGFKLPVILKKSNPVYLRFPVLVKDKDKILNSARKERLEIGDWFISPLHPVINNLEKLNYKKGMCPVAEKICEHIINLPTHLGITDKIAKKVLNFLKEMTI